MYIFFSFFLNQPNPASCRRIPGLCESKFKQFATFNRPNIFDFNLNDILQPKVKKYPINLAKS